MARLIQEPDTLPLFEDQSQVGADDRVVLDGENACCGMGWHWFNLLFSSKKEGPGDGAL